MEITNIDGVLFYGLQFPYDSEFPHRFEHGTYIFLIIDYDELYKKLRVSDYVSFMVGKDKVIAQIYLIRYLDGYNRYYCEEVERK